MNWTQLKAILRLRLCLTRNQFLRGGRFGAVVSMILGAAMVLMVVTSFAVGLSLGWLKMGEASPAMIMGTWAGLTLVFLFFWMIGLVHELQRSESIDLQRLMHLPVGLGQVFVINYLASHLAISILLFVPGMVGLAIGLGFSRGPLMWLLIPLALSMVFMVTSWTYCLRGWLAALMSNPRRRRSIVVGITFSVILLTQLPNLYFNLLRKRERATAQSAEERREQRVKRMADTRATIENVVACQKFVPPFWVSYGARELAEARPLPALLGALGCFAIGAMGLRRAFRGTVQFYLGGANQANAVAVTPPGTPAQSNVPAKEQTNWFERLLPGVPESAAALASATFRSMMRAPEVKMAWGTSMMVVVFIGGSLLARSAPTFSDALKPLIAVSILAVPLFFSAQFLVNPFGLDRHGFRSFVLAPVPRKHLLLGKNLAHLPMMAGFGILVFGVISWWLQLSLSSIFAALLQFMSMLLLAGMAGNLLSIVLPYQIAAGSMKPTKLPAAKMLGVVLSQFCFLLVMVPAALPPLVELIWRGTGGSGAVPVNLLLSFALLVLAGLAYWRTLDPLGRMLHQRETDILDVVAKEVE